MLFFVSWEQNILHGTLRAEKPIYKVIHTYFKVFLCFITILYKESTPIRFLPAGEESASVRSDKQIVLLFVRLFVILHSNKVCMIYPKNFEIKLGFDEIRTKIMGRCLSSLGIEEIEHLSFLTNAESINRLLRQVKEMRLILTGIEDFPTENFFDMREALIHIHVKGTYLEEPELFSLKSSLITASDIVKFLSADEDEDGKVLYPELKKLTEGLDTFPGIVETIDRILNKFGKIKDDASPELKKIRESLASTKRAMNVGLRKIMSKAQTDGIVDKDASPTFRDGRLVIPVAAGLKKRLRGIVHDESASGKTVFIEPAEVIEFGNHVRELEMEEKRAIIVILQNVAEQIRPYADELLQVYTFLGHIDAIRAKAVFADSIGGIEPVVSDTPILDWVSAVHPLLENSLARHGRKMTPIDMCVDEQNRILLISGPNAGGKSVCLKTAGLLQYMVQCGLPIPIRENSKVGLFQNLFIDIGDEQDIENELSTYSGHLLNMKFMMKNCNNRSLILIDEFGGGTEPQIGAAIAQAVLGRFLQSGTMGIITTHYQNLKEYADSHEGIQNGAMLYDRKLMQPLFQLQIGRPGSSFAIEIAHKIGLPDDVIREASDIVGSEYIQSDKYLQDIVRDKRYWENKRQNIHKKEKHLDELIQRYEDDMRELEKRRRRVLDSAREKAEELLKESNAQIENTIRSIKEAQADKEETKRIRQNLATFKESIAGDGSKGEELIDRKMKQIMERRARREKRKKERAAKGESAGASVSVPNNTTELPKIDVGSFVRIKGGDAVLRVIKIQNGTATVSGGSVQMSVNLSRLIPAEAPKKETENKASFIGRETMDEIYEKKLKFKPEIDVRGMSGEEALSAVTYFIDDAILLGVSRVRILHGTGSGYLRSIIRQYLRSIPNVAGAHDEHVQFGGAGITVVELN